MGLFKVVEQERIIYKGKPDIKSELEKMDEEVGRMSEKEKKKLWNKVSKDLGLNDLLGDYDFHKSWKDKIEEDKTKMAVYAYFMGLTAVVVTILAYLVVKELFWKLG